MSYQRPYDSEEEEEFFSEDEDMDVGEGEEEGEEDNNEYPTPQPLYAPQSKSNFTGGQSSINRYSYAQPRTTPSQYVGATRTLPSYGSGYGATQPAPSAVGFRAPPARTYAPSNYNQTTSVRNRGPAIPQSGDNWLTKGQPIPPRSQPSYRSQYAYPDSG